jgi:hypothetical protein
MHASQRSAGQSSEAPTQVACLTYVNGREGLFLEPFEHASTIRSLQARNPSSAGELSALCSLSQAGLARGVDLHQ